MAPERTRHGEVKFAGSWRLSRDPEAGLPCHMHADGCAPTRGAGYRAQINVLVCRTQAPGRSDQVPNPVIVVEVSSPSTRKIDTTLKLAGYFRLASVEHYLIVDPNGPPVIHHQRQADDTI